mmetsp:Transcript_8334/g.14504  ORF Transcript_8334/g.14504 Transcript_8334/m.14504 type:complete len:83 (-) Transcript_8334:111-359(-)
MVYNEIFTTNNNLSGFSLQFVTKDSADEQETLIIVICRGYIFWQSCDELSLNIAVAMIPMVPLTRLYSSTSLISNTTQTQQE